LEQTSGENAIFEIVRKLLANNSNCIVDYKEGKDKTIEYPAGQTMKALKSRGIPRL